LGNAGEVSYEFGNRLKGINQRRPLVQDLSTLEGHDRNLDYCVVVRIEASGFQVNGNVGSGHEIVGQL
jgi:hypothetical protein